MQRRGLGPLLCYVMGLNESNHFSCLTSAFRVAYEQSYLKVGLISVFDRRTSLKVGLISAFDRHTSINASISADHALADALEFPGEWRNLKKVSSFHYLTMYLNSFVPKTKHNCGCISQVCIYKGCLLYTSPSPRDGLLSRMPSSA